MITSQNLLNCRPLKIFLWNILFQTNCHWRKTPQTFRLLPVETVNTLSENESDTDEINEQQDVDIVQNGITMESVLSEWKGLARSPQNRILVGLIQ